jgi:hypothetical protein
MDDSLGVAFRTVPMTARFKALPQVQMVIDFAVEYDPNVAVFVAQRLVTGLDIDDAEAAHRQSDILFNKEAFVVRAPVNDPPVHRVEEAGIHLPVSIGVKNAADSAHGYE